MAITTSTWTTGIGGDWSVTSDWTPTGAPNSNSVAVLINAAPVGGTPYTVSVANGSSFAAQSVTLGNTAATLSVAGTLNLNGGSIAATAGTVALNGGAILNPGTLTGIVHGNGQFNGASVLVNQGTINDDNGVLFILTTLNNGGVVEVSGAGGGFLGIEGPAFSNLSAGTLTGGTLIAQGNGPSFNILGLTVGGRITTDAATIILDGPASDIQALVSGSFESVVTEIKTIAAIGVLKALNGRNFLSGNSITDAGTLVLGGGTLSTAGLTVTGLLQGAGTVAGAVANAGTVAVTGSLMSVGSAITGAGAISVAGGSTLILHGATAATLADNGIVFNASGVLNVGTLTGTGTLVAENGSTVELGHASGQTIVFGGANATVRLDDPLGFTGTLVGLGAGDMLFNGDTLVLSGLQANSATIINGNTLAVASGGTVVDTITLAGTYTGATFSASVSGADTVIRNLTGAPPRDGITDTVSLTDQAGLSVAQENLIIADFNQAMADWGRYITGHTSLRVALTIANSTNGAVLAQAAPTLLTPSGQIINGETIWTPSSIYALNTGSYVAGAASDMQVTLFAGGTNLASLFINPTSTAVPSSLYDLTSVFRHEIEHGLGMTGFIDATTGALGPNATLYDIDVASQLNGGTVTTATFNGPLTESAYGTLLGIGLPTVVPLTALNNGENIYHFANLTTDPLAHDLMNGIGLLPGTSVAISPIDLAVLRDVGLNVSAGVLCFCAGTRIATPDGDVLVERLRAGDLVVTASGRIRPLTWVGSGTAMVARGRRSAATPVILRKGALADNVPNRDLRVTKGHSFLIDDVLIPAEFLVNHRSILWDDHALEVRIHHLETAEHDVLLANGAPAESYRDDGNRWLFENANTGWDQPPKPPCAPVLTGGPLVDAVWHRLLARSQSRPGLPLTSDADPHLLVDGIRVDPLSQSQDRLQFLLPWPAAQVRLGSRAGSPAELGLARDPRVLGLAVRQFRLWRGQQVRVLDAADPRLTAGYHGFEADGGRRWTLGDAEIPEALFADLSGPCLLEVLLAGATPYPLLYEVPRAA